MKLCVIERVGQIAEVLKDKDLTKDERRIISDSLQDIIGIVDSLTKGGEKVDR